MNPMEGLSPEDMQVMMQLIMQGQTAGAEQKGIDRQLKQAESLRGQAPQMMQGGRIQSAPHWLDMVGSLGSEYAGSQMNKQADKRQKDLGSQTAEQNQRLLELLGRMQAQKAAPPTPAPQPMPGAGGGINPGMPMGQGMKMPQPPQAGMMPGMQQPFSM